MTAFRNVLRSLRSGEGVLPLALIVLGAYWMAQALRLGLWNGARPDSGLMPFIYGALMIVFSGAVLIFIGHEGPAGEQEPIGKPALLIGLMILTVLGFRLIGGVASLFLMTAVTYVAIERLPLVRSIATSAAVTAVYYVVFDRWLSVTLPQGPWGF